MVGELAFWHTVQQSEPWMQHQRQSCIHTHERWPAVHEAKFDFLGVKLPKASAQLPHCAIHSVLKPADDCVTNFTFSPLLTWKEIKQYNSAAFLVFPISLGLRHSKCKVTGKRVFGTRSASCEKITQIVTLTLKLSTLPGDLVYSQANSSVTLYANISPLTFFQWQS